MNEYKNFKYREIKPGVWEVIFPTKFKTFITAESEPKLHTAIDDIEKFHKTSGG